MNKILYHFSKMTNAAQNLALEEFIFRHRREGFIFLLWHNAPCVIIGKNQVAASEVDLAFARSHDIPVYQRHTGGGAVYHDLGNINFTFIDDYNPENPPRFSSLVSPIVDFLRQMNLPAISGSRNDLLVCKHKVCGTAFIIDKCRKQAEGSLSFSDGKPQNSFFSTAVFDSDQPLDGAEKDPLISLPLETEASGPVKARILVHGCILFDTDLDMLSQVLTPPPDKLIRHGIPSVRSRVANLKDFLPVETIESFQKKLIDSIFSKKTPEKLLLRLEEVKSIFARAESYRNFA